MKFKMVALILFLILPALVMAQAMAVKPIDVVKIAFVVKGESPHCEELDKLLRSELDVLRKRMGRSIDVVFVSSSRSDYIVQIVIMSIDSEDGFTGYAATMLIDKASGEREVSLYVSRETRLLAARIAKTLSETFKATRRVASTKEN